MVGSYVDYNRDAEHDIINEISNYISQLSDGSNIYTIKDAEARNSIANLANVATSGDYNDLTNKPTIPTSVAELSDASDYVTTNNIITVNSITLANVATSGDYNDLSNKPTIPDAQVQSDWNAVSGMGVILNKPTIPVVDSSYNSTSNNAQSGVAINGLMTTKFQVVDSLPANPSPDVFYFIKE